MRVYLSPVKSDPASQFMCAGQGKCVDIHFSCEANHFSDCAEGSEEKYKHYRSDCECCGVYMGAGIVEYMKEWRRLLVG